MRRLKIVLALLLFAGCGGEHRVEPEQVHRTSPVKRATPAPPPVARPASRSTPEQCAGDGSYEQAVDCIRIASSLRFTFDDGSGKLERPRPGSERMSLNVTKGADRGTWVAEAKTTGILWTHDGKRTAAVPSTLERLYQRLTLFPDPQKKEGTAQVVSREAGSIHYAFTDINSGDAYEVAVGTTDGAIQKLRVGTSTIVFTG